MPNRYTYDVIIIRADNTRARLVTSLPEPNVESFTHEGYWFDYIGSQEGDRIYRERTTKTNI